MAQFTAKGVDSNGKAFGSVEELWSAELGNVDSSGKDTWYTKGIEYWDNVDATVDGVLGGFGHVSGVDVKESALFIRGNMAERLAATATSASPLVAIGGSTYPKP
ncbi:hypothetical protein CYMTET_33145, partial [Cymbomonas tetramitiformis]